MTNETKKQSAIMDAESAIEKWTEETKNIRKSIVIIKKSFGENWESNVEAVARIGKCCERIAVLNHRITFNRGILYENTVMA